MASSRTHKVLVLSSGSALSNLVALISAGFLSRYLAQDEYGTYRQALLVFTFASPFLILGLPQTLFRFLPGEKLRPLGMILENVAITALLAGVFAAFLLLGGNHLLAWLFDNSALLGMLLLLAPYAIFAGMSQTVGPCLTALDQSSLAALYNLSSRLLMLGGIVAGTLAVGSAFGALVGSTVATGLAALAGLALMIRMSGGGDRTLSRVGMMAQLRFAVPLGLSGVVGTIILNVDKVIVSAMATRAEFAVYVNGAIQVPLVGIVSASVTSVLLPEMVVNQKEGRPADSIPLWHLAFQRIGTVLVPLAVFLIALAPEAMRLLYGPGYAASAEPFRIYLLMLFIVRPAALDALLLAAGRSDIILRRTLGSLGFNVVLSLVLVPTVGYLGAAIGTVISSHLWTLPYTLKMVSRIYAVPVRQLVPTRMAVSLILLALVPAPLLMLAGAGHLPDGASLAVSSLVYFPCVGLLYHRFRIVDLRHVLRRAARILRRRRSVG